MNRELLDDHRQALTVVCDPADGGCGSAPGEPCTRPTATGERVPLEHFPAHIPRLKAAGVAHAPIDSRDLRRAD